MGKFYSLGVIKNFTARSNKYLTMEEWKTALQDRLDLSCFELTQDENEKLHGTLHEELFEENIDDFYDVLKKILGKNRNTNIDYYQETFGNDINDYQIEYSKIQFNPEEHIDITVEFNYAMLFIEGKVMAEEFYTEPILLNWLFRNSTIENKLAGCIASYVTG
ncbi:hypothetical protein [Oceanobacillus sp. CAU 1775]